MPSPNVSARQWLILGLALVAIAGLLGIDRYAAYRGVIADEA